MSQRRRPFYQADITRALKAARAAGFDISGCRIGPDGALDIQFAGAEDKMTALQAWKAGRHRDAG